MARLKGLNIDDACTDGANAFNGFNTPQDFVKNCHRGDWLLWLFAHTNPDDKRRLTLAKAFCAATVIHLMKDKRSIDAVYTATMYGLGFRSDEELMAAEEAAINAHDNDDNHSFATYAATSTAAGHHVADYDYVTAVNTAHAEFYAAYAENNNHDEAEAAREKNQALTADICRKFLPIEIWNFRRKNHDRKTSTIPQ